MYTCMYTYILIMTPLILRHYMYVFAPPSQSSQSNIPCTCTNVLLSKTRKWFTPMNPQQTCRLIICTCTCTYMCTTYRASGVAITYVVKINVQDKAKNRDTCMHIPTCTCICQAPSCKQLLYYFSRTWTIFVQGQGPV